MNNKDFNTILKKVDEILPPKEFVGFQVGDTEKNGFNQCNYPDREVSEPLPHAVSSSRSHR